ncbi:MAG: beta-ketoacyl-[acyl-carrier-protein] synthase family protein, partial [Alphaproteobacteria bacterium]|nr:beta-ketoacyl-[acyl-carrier-protein] synthase family protein [Alphaproteobacteria bacterium]
ASACASSTHAIGTAYHMVRSGMVRAAMTGGSEATLTLGCLKGWEALRVMSPDFCRPFSKGRQGMVLGEGAGCLMLERMDDATARGAKILAEMIGFGQSCDARDITTPDQGGMMRALQNALHDAGVEPTQVVHINAHGTGTRANDTTESAALKDVFGDHLHGMKTTANKSLFGHALGAAGALEMVATVLSLHHQRVPPTLHFVEPDPDCALVPITTTTETLPQGAIAIKNSFAFGGLNAVLVVRGC